MNNPEDQSAGKRKVPFSRVLYIEQDDFRETPPPKYFRLSPGNEVRLRCGLFHQVHERGEGRGRRSHRSALHLRPRHHAAATPPTAARSRARSTGSRPPHALDAEVRLYDHLFKTADPEDVPEGQDWKANFNPNSAWRLMRMRRSSRA